MRHFFLKNIFTPDDKDMIDWAVRGMMKANACEEHAGQNDGAYGGFSDALRRIIRVRYGDDAADSFYNRYNWDHYCGEDFFEWFDAIVKEDTREVTDMLAGASISV